MSSDTTSLHPAIAPRDQFLASRERLAETFLKSGNVEEYLCGHTAALDLAVKALIKEADLPPTLAIVAVGGYGRAELFPFSDIDLLILQPEAFKNDPTLNERISQFTTRLWELGLSVGASVRSEKEFLSEAMHDVTIATTYLEARCLWGDDALFSHSWDNFYANLDARAFFRDKMLEMQRRHQKFEETPYSLEPNLKESPGGLRDLQIFQWCAKAAGLAQNFSDMMNNHLITERELHTLTQSQHFLNNLRLRLHLRQRRHEDRLIFDVQEGLALSMGYHASSNMRASEALMKRYYLNAKAVTQMSVIQLQAISDRLLGSNAHATPVPLDPAFVAMGDEMDLVTPHVFESDLNALLRAFLVFNSHPEVTRMSTRLLRTIWHASFKIDEAYRQDPANKATFLSILKMTKGCYHALKQMNMWGILGRFLPSWRHIVGQMQHDLFHIYTVDQHTLRTVRNLRRFARSEYAHEYPACTKIMAELPRNWRVVIAGLFHDISKGLGGNHAILGAQAMSEFAKDYDFNDDDRAFLCFLVREHLTMSQVAQKQDISDPEVIERFVNVVQNKERLDALYLLTVADIRATSPKVWNTWKAQLLESLYSASLSVLLGDKGEQSRASVLENRQQAAMTLLGQSVANDARERLWKELDIVYFMRHSAEEIAWHTRVLAHHVTQTSPIVRAKLSEKMGGMVIVVYLPDCKDLFLRAVAYLGKRGLSIMDARIHTTRHGWALDTFLVSDRLARLEPEELIERIEREMGDALTATGPLPSPPKGQLSRRSRHFPTRPSVVIRPDESGRAWLLTIICTDRLGLLFAISEVLARWHVNLQTAKIATLGERAEDVFLVDGAILREDDKLLALEAELLEAIRTPSN